MESEDIIERTRCWIATMVIGLNLCPFAQRVFQGGLIRYAVSDARDTTTLLAALARELTVLATVPIQSVETTLLIHPHVLANFLDYNEFLGLGDRLVGDLGLRGTFQIASFHPDYQFAGTQAGATENYTNRAPYPMLHLLREASISAVAADPTRLLEIPRRNAEILRNLGEAKILKRLRGMTDSSER